MSADPVHAALPPTNVAEELSAALASARAALSGFLELIALEARRASIALMWMVAGSLLAVIFFASAWLGLMAAVAMGAVSLGLPPIATVIVVAALNLLGGAAMIYACIGWSRDLLFAATRRQVDAAFPAAPRLP